MYYKYISCAYTFKNIVVQPIVNTTQLHPKIICFSFKWINGRLFFYRLRKIFLRQSIFKSYFFGLTVTMYNEFEEFNSLQASIINNFRSLACTFCMWFMRIIRFVNLCKLFLTYCWLTYLLWPFSALYPRSHFNPLVSGVRLLILSWKLF